MPQSITFRRVTSRLNRTWPMVWLQRGVRKGWSTIRPFRRIEIEPGLSIRAYTDSILCRCGIAAGTFENAEQDFVRRALRPGDCFIDVGANVGLFTLIGAKAVGAAGRVYSFEPCKSTFERLVENVNENHLLNVECLCLALSDEPAQRELHISLDGYDAWNTFAKPVAGGRFTSERVEAVRWDDFAADRLAGVPISLMKIDVEGWEQQVLLGSKKSLSHPDAPTLLVEFTEENAIAAGNRCRDVFSLLESFGYELYEYTRDPPALSRAANREFFEYVNLCAIKPHKYDEVSERIRETTGQIAIPHAR